MKEKEVVSTLKDKYNSQSKNKKIKDDKKEVNIPKKEYVITGIEGFDKLFEKGIPKGSSVLISGGAGSGKTIFCLQLAAYHASKGRKCYYMSFEESEEKLLQHNLLP